MQVFVAISSLIVRVGYFYIMNILIIDNCKQGSLEPCSKCPTQNVYLVVLPVSGNETPLTKLASSKDVIVDSTLCFINVLPLPPAKTLYKCLRVNNGIYS